MFEKLLAKQHIRHLDLGAVRRMAVEKLGWGEERASEVENGYKRCLYALAHKHRHEVLSPPSHDVDEFWHQHILNTPKYREDCDRFLVAMWITRQGWMRNGSERRTPGAGKSTSGTISIRSILIRLIHPMRPPIGMTLFLASMALILTEVTVETVATMLRVMPVIRAAMVVAAAVAVEAAEGANGGLR